MKLLKNQRIFLSYAWTGEDKAIITSHMKAVCDVLEHHGFDVYCSIYDNATKGFESPQQYILLALDELKRSDMVLVVQSSERRSEGMLVEVGAALSQNKQIIVARHVSALDKSYLYSLADYSFDFETSQELVESIERVL